MYEGGVLKNSLSQGALPRCNTRTRGSAPAISQISVSNKELGTEI